ncbi:hypothetical protein ABKN59_005728 [Abortiporus biennis]
MLGSIYASSRMNTKARSLALFRRYSETLVDGSHRYNLDDNPTSGCIPSKVTSRAKFRRVGSLIFQRQKYKKARKHASSAGTSYIETVLFFDCGNTS